MKVFRVTTDVNRFQYFLPKDDERSDAFEMNGTPIADEWEAPEVIIYKPKLKRSDFLNFTGECLILSPRARDLVGEFIEESGELLPVMYKGIEYTALNVTECIECLDQSKTTFTTSGAIATYAFEPSNFAEISLFKIPETANSEILLLEGLREPDEEFRAVVQSSGLQGLEFTLLWQS